jgi:hypothetical protein
MVADSMRSGILHLFKYLILLWMQTAGPHFENPVPAQELSFSAKPNPFKLLKKHATMTNLNAHIVPWLIAEFGQDYADWDNVHCLFKVCFAQSR